MDNWSDIMRCRIPVQYSGKGASEGPAILPSSTGYHEGSMNFINHASKIVVFILLIHFSDSFMIRNGSDCDNVKRLESVAAEYVKNIRNSSVVHVVLQRGVCDDTSEPILKTLGSLVPVVLQYSDFEPVITTKMTNIFGIFSNPDGIQPHRWKELHGTSLPSSAQIALLIHTSNSTTATIRPILDNFWQQEMINVIAITPTHLPLIHTYNPFPIRPQALSLPGEIVNLTDKFFPDKLKNLHQHPVRIIFYENPPYVYPRTHPTPMDGSDYALMSFLSARLNFSMKFTMKLSTFADTFFRLSNDRRTSALGEVLIKNADILGNSFYLESTNGQELDILYPRWRTALVAIVPRTRPIRGILNMFSSVDLGVLILFCIVMILLVIYLHVEKDTHIFIHVWRLLMYQHFDFIGERASERFFCMSFVIWSFFLLEFYEGRLVNDLSSSFYNDIHSLRELIDSNLTVLVPSWQKAVMNHSHIQERIELARQLEIEGNFTRCAIRAIEAGNVGCTMDANAADYFKNQIMMQNQNIANEDNDESKVRGQLRVVEESIMSFWRLHATRKGFFLREKINQLKAVITECGLLKKWESDEHDRQFREHAEVQKESVGMDKMGAAFQLLLYGHVIALGQLIIEVLCHFVKIKYFKWYSEDDFFTG